MTASSLTFQASPTWLTDGSPGASTPDTVSSSSQGGATSDASILQWSQAGAQTGIDLLLAKGPGYDLNAWEAESRGEMTASGKYSKEQINAYIQTAKDAFNAAITVEQNADASISAAAGTPGASPTPLNYQQFSAQVASQVLPLGVEPMPLAGAYSSAGDRKSAAGGAQLASTLGPDAQLDQIAAVSTNKILGYRGTLHQAAVFNLATDQSYRATQAAKDPVTTDPSTSAGAGSTPAADKPPALPGASPEVTAWYNGEGPSTFNPTVGDWSKLIAYLNGTEVSADDRNKIVAQIKAKHPDWGTNLEAALKPGPDTADQRAAKNYQPYLAVAPGLATGDGQDTALAMVFDPANANAPLNQTDFAQASMALLALHKNSPDKYQQALDMIPSGARKLALQNVVGSFESGNGGKDFQDYSQGDIDQARKASQFFKNNYSTYADNNGWINGGAGATSSYYY